MHHYKHGTAITPGESAEPGIGRGCGAVTWIVRPDGSGPAAVGEEGELWLEGPIVGRGYLGDAERLPPPSSRNPHGSFEAEQAFPAVEAACIVPATSCVTVLTAPSTSSAVRTTRSRSAASASSSAMSSTTCASVSPPTRISLS
ncbi:hypothetical protein GJ744_001477 [Endocarpon pusillum]|uniref:AMP-dependent synthetase/ligase domain-containing protein n=1 Tax=Endocarpon pusillum TaxID=364733 RepID=A0A8H7A9J3_9EURO|nr:hypothetical protein GJ744_001477 [Endocarpon pusillum]